VASLDPDQGTGKALSPNYLAYATGILRVGLLSVGYVNARLRLALRSILPNVGNLSRARHRDSDAASPCESWDQASAAISH
jgi:hypothetical protein